jgi:hypothetical protein
MPNSISRINVTLFLSTACEAVIPDSSPRSVESNTYRMSVFSEANLSISDLNVRIREVMNRDFSIPLLDSNFRVVLTSLTGRVVSVRPEHLSDCPREGESYNLFFFYSREI